MKSNLLYYILTICTFKYLFIISDVCFRLCILIMSEQQSRVLVKSPQQGSVSSSGADAVTQSTKRYLFEPSCENEPLTSYTNKKARTMSETAEIEDSSDVCLEKQVCGLNSNKKSLFEPPVNAYNPLSERNIRVDCDNNNSSCKNTNFKTLNINETITIDYEDNSINNKSCLPQTFSINLTEQNKETNYNENETLNESENSLKSAISSLDASHESRGDTNSSTLDYVARLPDGCALLEDVSATPPHHTNGQHYSGDEDDDNYLDSSEEEQDDAVTADTLDIEDSCDEGLLHRSLGPVS